VPKPRKQRREHRCTGHSADALVSDAVVAIADASEEGDQWTEPFGMNDGVHEAACARQHKQQLAAPRERGALARVQACHSRRQLRRRCKDITSLKTVRKID